MPFFNIAYVAAKYVGIRDNAFPERREVNNRRQARHHSGRRPPPSREVFSSASAFEAWTSSSCSSRDSDPKHSFQFVEESMSRRTSMARSLLTIPRLCRACTCPHLRHVGRLHISAAADADIHDGLAASAIAAFSLTPSGPDLNRYTLRRSNRPSGRRIRCGVPEGDDGGYPLFAGGVALAPFDIISDFMRGMRGTAQSTCIAGPTSSRGSEQRCSPGRSAGPWPNAR